MRQKKETSAIAPAMSLSNLQTPQEDKMKNFEYTSRYIALVLAVETQMQRVGENPQGETKTMASEFDSAFIQKAEHRPKPNISEAGGIPLIDLSPLLTTPVPSDGVEIPAALKGLVAEIEAACSVVGFFQVINHGVPIELLEGIQSAARQFFALPLEEKRRVRRNQENFLGYYDTELTKNVRDWKEVFDFTANDPMTVLASSEPGETRVQEVRNRWPEHPAEMRLELK